MRGHHPAHSIHRMDVGEQAAPLLTTSSCDGVGCCPSLGRKLMEQSRPTDPNILEALPCPSCAPVLDGARAHASTRKAAHRCQWPLCSSRVTEIKLMDVSRLIIIYSGTLGSDALKRTAGCQQHIYQEFKRPQQPYNPEDLMTEWNECWINVLFDKLTNILGNTTVIDILLGEINKLRISRPCGDQILWMCIFQSNLFSLDIRGKQNIEFSTCKKLQIFAMQLACYSVLPKSSKKNLLHTKNNGTEIQGWSTVKPQNDHSKIQSLWLSKCLNPKSSLHCVKMFPCIMVESLQFSDA